MTEAPDGAPHRSASSPECWPLLRSCPHLFGDADRVRTGIFAPAMDPLDVVGESSSIRLSAFLSMVSGYVRLPLPMSIALQRFDEWIGLPALQPPKHVRARDSVDEACEDGDWRGVAVFVHEANGWTVFDDYTGYLGALPASRWVSLAGDVELVFAAYNDAIPYGQLIVVRHGRVVREFLHDLQDPSHDVNHGRLELERATLIDDWVDAASFVDGDVLADDGADEGTLLLYRDDVPESAQSHADTTDSR